MDAYDEFPKEMEYILETIELNLLSNPDAESISVRSRIFGKPEPLLSKILTAFKHPYIGWRLSAWSQDVDFYPITGELFASMDGSTGMTYVFSRKAENGDTGGGHVRE